MLSWALARHHALEEENKCLGTIFTRMISQEYIILYYTTAKQTPSNTYCIETILVTYTKKHVSSVSGKRLLSHHHECRQSIGSESVETNAMADALQDAKDALADAKLRMRVAEVGV